MCHLPFLQRGVSIISAEEGVFLYLFLIRTAGSFLRHKLCPFHRPKRKVRPEQMPGKRKVPGRAVQCSSQDFMSNVVDPQGLEPWTDRL